MPNPYASGVVAASVGKVWDVVREFNGLASYLPGIVASELVGGSEGQVGVVRRLKTTAGEEQVHEKLLSLDDTGRTYSYGFADGNPFGIRNYISTIRVAPVTDTGETFVEWWAEFDADSATEDELVRTFALGVYASGINGLRALLG
jgi:hypothetical protein